MLAVIAFVTLAAPPVAGQRVLDGCRDRYDHPVVRVEDNTITYAGLAAYRHGRPVIIWNARVNARLSPAERIYIYLHECAHHRLGHLEELAHDARWELEADCWAIQTMVDGGMIRTRELRRLERARATARSDATHLGGEAHARSLRACLEVRTDRNAWAAALEAMHRASAEGFAGTRGRLVDSLNGVAVHESLVNAPGTYDCEVVGPAIRCRLFESLKPGSALKRYERLVRILEDWLPAHWTVLERRRRDGTADTFVARDRAGETRLTLAREGARVELRMQRAEAFP